MTPEQFDAWLDEMISMGLAKDRAECAKMLGVDWMTMHKRRHEGADLETALACRALVHRLKPYDG